MKITCPKCQSTYKVDLPDPGEAGIDVQCGKCLYVFVFSTRPEKSSHSEKQKDILKEIRHPDLTESRSSESILTPQKDEDQELSNSENPPLEMVQTTSTPHEEEPKDAEKLELEPIGDEPESVEVVVEDDEQEESLEEVALDDIWNQAVQEGARTTAEATEISSTPSNGKAAEESKEKESGDQTPRPPQKKSKSLPSLEERQREIDQMIADHQATHKAPEDSSPEESPPSSASEENPQENKDQEEQVVIKEEEDMPNWEEAFLHQSQVEEGWKKAQEQDRIHEEQQLADALGKNIASETAPKDPADVDISEESQDLVDAIFAEAQAPEKSQELTEETSKTELQKDPKEQEIDEIFAANQEDTDSGEPEMSDTADAMPSWEEAFADQSEVESGWKKSQEKDRIHEEQQLAEALGEEYVPSESGEEKTPPATSQQSEEPQETKTQDAPLEEPEEKPFSPETETLVAGHTIPGEIDLMSDLDDLNMKQLVSQAFKEESESEEKAKQTAPETEEDEPALETELTLETADEVSHHDETSDPIPELEMESDPELTLELETEPEVTESSVPEEPPEEDIPELTLESAEEEPEENKLHELESLLDTAETQEEVEALIAELPDDSEPELTLEATEEDPGSVQTLFDEEESEVEPIIEVAETTEEKEPETAEAPLEMEPIPELTVESEEETETVASQPGPRPLMEEDDEIWNHLLAGNEEPEQPAEVEASTASVQAETEDPIEANDFWDQVLEKESLEEPTAAETESEKHAAASAPATPETSERDALTDEDLWKQAFPGDEDFEPAAAKTFDSDKEDSETEPPPLVIGATVPQDTDSSDSLPYDEAAYEDYDDDDDEFEFERRKRKLGPFAIPHGRRGDMVVGGAVLVFLLIAGSVYFTLQTFAPGELTKIETAKTEVPEGLTPREVPLDELTEDLIAPKPEKTPPVDKPDDAGKATLSDPADILKESPQEKGILKDLAESQILKETGKSQSARIDESALQALTGNSVTLSTIMPVAYNPTDIRVLSFSVEMQLSDARSAKRVRESLPMYEDLMTQTVENFLRRKFYNDVLYVKEKLQKRLQTAMNQSLKNGRVRKAKFTDFAIQ